jgi:WD40 repeat protein
MSTHSGLLWALVGLALVTEVRAGQPRTDAAGDPLPPGSVARLGTLRLRHTHQVYAVAFSPTSNLLASAGVDHVVRLWDPATGKQKRRLVGHLGMIDALAFAPDGKVLVTVARDLTLRSWDPETGKEVTPPRSCRFRNNFLACSPDGKLLALPGAYGAVRLWDVAAAKEVRVLQVRHLATAAAFAPDGKTLAATASDGNNSTLSLWDVATGRRTQRFTARRWHLSCVAFSPDGRVLASAGFGQRQGKPHGEVMLRDTATGKELRWLAVPGSLFSVRFSPDGKFLAATGRPGKTRLWALDPKGVPRLVWEDAAGGDSVTFSPGGKLLAWCTGRAVRVLDTTTLKELAPAGHRREVQFVAFTGGGKEVVSAGDTVCVWDAATGRLRRTVAGPLTRLACAALAPDGRALLTGSEDGTTLWDLTNGEVAQEFPIENGFAWGAVFSPDGRSLATAVHRWTPFTDEKGRAMVRYEWEKSFRLWEVSTGKESRRLGDHHYASSLAFTRDGKRFASSSGEVCVWDVATGKRIATMITRDTWSPAPSSLSFSPDGRHLAGGDYHGTVYLWDPSTGKVVRRLLGHQDRVRAVAFSPDGKLLLSGGDDGTARLWAVADGKLLATAAGHRAGVWAVAFAPGGRRIATGSADTTVLVWDVAALRRAGSPLAPALTAAELNDMWIGLAAQSPSGVGGRAVRRLAASPASSIPFLKRRLAEAPGPRVKRLLADLDSRRFAVRREAARELAELGCAILPALRKILASRPSLEMRRRLEELLGGLPASPGLRFEDTPEGRRLRRTVAVLVRVGTPEALAVLQELTADPVMRRVLEEGHGTSLLLREAKAALERAR